MDSGIHRTSTDLDEVLQVLTETSDPVLRSVAVPTTFHVNARGVIDRVYTHTKAEGVTATELPYPPGAEEVFGMFGVHDVPALSAEDLPPEEGTGQVLGGLDVVAVFTTTTPQISIDFLSHERLAVFLQSARPPGLLQKYHSFSDHHSMTQAVWTPYLLIVEKRQSAAHVKDLNVPVGRRFATAASKHSSQRPVSQTSKKLIEEVCRRMSTVWSARTRTETHSNGKTTAHMSSVMRIVSYFSCLQPLTLMCVSGTEFQVKNVEKRAKLNISQRFYNKTYFSEAEEGAEVPKPQAHITNPPVSPSQSVPDVYDGAVRAEEYPKDVTASISVSLPDDTKQLQHVDLFMCATPNQAQAPDAYLLLKTGGEVVQTVPSQEPCPAQKQQISNALRSVRDMQQHAHAVDEGVSFDAPNTTHSPEGTIVTLASAGFTNGNMLRMRKKYGMVAADNILMGDTKPVVVTCGDVEKLPRPSRKHIVHDVTVVGAATPETFRTRPATAPQSKLLSYLQEMDEQEMPTSLREIAMTLPPQGALHKAASRLKRRRVVSAKEKLRMAIPSLEMGSRYPLRIKRTKPSHTHTASTGRRGETWDQCVVLSPKGPSTASQTTPARYPPSYGDRNNPPTVLPLRPPCTHKAHSHLDDLSTRDGISTAGTPQIHIKEPHPHLHTGDVESLREYGAQQRRKLRQLLEVGGAESPITSVAQSEEADSSYPEDVNRKSIERVVPKAKVYDPDNMHHSVSEMLRARHAAKHKSAERRRRKRVQQLDAELLNPQNFFSAKESKAPPLRSSQRYDFLVTLFGDEPLEKESENDSQNASVRAAEVGICEGRRRLEAVVTNAALERKKRLEETMERARTRNIVSNIYTKARADVTLLLVEDFLYASYSKSLCMRSKTPKAYARKLHSPVHDSASPRNNMWDGNVQFCYFVIPEELHSVVFHVHSLLTVLGFAHSETDGEDENGRYGLPDVAVTIAGVLTELNGLRVLLNKVAESSEEVSLKLKHLVEPTPLEHAVPLYEAVLSLAEEFHLG